MAEAQAGAESHAAIAAKHGVTEAALKYHFYKARKRPLRRREYPCYRCASATKRA